MHTRQRQINRPFGMLAMLFCGLASVSSIACGGDSGTATTPADKFIGRWQNDESSTTGTFTANCQAAGVVSHFFIWTDLDFERATLTDVTDVSTTCFQPGLSFNVDGTHNALTVANPDPYVMAVAPDNQPSCVSNLGSDGSAGQLFFVLTVDTASFTLVQHAAGTAPIGLFAVSGSADVVDVDSMNNASTVDTCTYTGTGDQFHQMTRL